MIKKLIKLIQKKMREGEVVNEIYYNKKEDNERIKKDKIIREVMRRLRDK